MLDIIEHTSLNIEQAVSSAEKYLFQLRLAESSLYENFPAYPSDEVCINLGNPQPFHGDGGKNTVLPGWQLIYSGKNEENGFAGMAYWHKAHRHLVIVHSAMYPNSQDIQMVEDAKQFSLMVLNKFKKMSPVSIVCTGLFSRKELAQIAADCIEEEKAKNRRSLNLPETGLRVRVVIIKDSAKRYKQEAPSKDDLYDIRYYSVEGAENNSDSHPLNTSAFNEPTQRFLTCYIEVGRVIGQSSIKVLQDKFSALGLTQLPALLEGLSLEEIPNSSVKILHAKNPDNLAHYLYHTALVYPEFFHQNFDLFEEILNKVKIQSDSSSSSHIAASLFGKAHDVTVAFVRDKGISVPDTITPDLFERLIDKYLNHMEAASKIPLVGEATGKATVGSVERTKFHMYDSKNPGASSPVSLSPEESQDIGGMFFIAGTKITLQLVKIPGNKKPAIFKLMQDYADNYIAKEKSKSHLKQSKQGIFFIDLEDKALTNELAKGLCDTLGLTFDATEKKELTLKKDKGKLVSSS